MSTITVAPAEARAMVARCWLSAAEPASRPAGPEDAGADLRLGDVTLHAHQLSAVRELRWMLARSGGALLADETGLGKTYVALAVARRSRQPLVVAPAGLRRMWADAAARAGVPLIWCSMESLARPSAGTGGDAYELVIVDEAHHFRNPATARYRTLARLTARSQVLLLSATPIHNRMGDLTALLALFLGTRAWLLDDTERAHHIVRRRHATVHATCSSEPGGRLPPVVGPHRVSIADDGATLDALIALPPAVPPSDGGDAGALTSFSLVKQWASSAGALRGALHRRLERAAALASGLEAGRRPAYRELRAWCVGEGAVQLAFPELLVPRSADTGPLLEAVRTHADAVRALLRGIASGPDADAARAMRLREIVAAHGGTKVVAFAAYEDTVRTLYRHLRREVRACALGAAGAVVAGGRLRRREAIMRFVSGAGGAAVGHGAAAERIDLLLTTDLLSEGVDLQAAGVVVHLDLPWTPARLAQRVGRVARLGCPHEHVHVYAFDPPAAAGALLAMERRLRDKLNAAGRAVGLAGAILPPLIAGPPSSAPAGRTSDSEASAAPAEHLAAARMAVGRWVDVRWRAARRVPREARDDRETTCAAVRSPVAGFLAAVMEGAHPLLVATCGGPVTADPTIVARAVEMAEGPAAAVTAAAFDRAVRAAADWCTARRAAAEAGLTVAVGGAGRRRVLTRIARIVHGAPTHLRPRLAALVRRARAAAVVPCGAGAERVLAQLADAPLPDTAWLRAVGAFGESHASRDRGGDDALAGPSVVAVILLVPASGEA